MNSGVLDRDRLFWGSEGVLLNRVLMTTVSLGEDVDDFAMREEFVDSLEAEVGKSSYAAGAIQFPGYYSGIACCQTIQVNDNSAPALRLTLSARNGA